MGHASASRIFFVAALLASAALGGCGRRGPLELPPGTPNAQAENPTALANQQAATLNQTAPPGVIQSPDQVVENNKSSAQVAAQPAPAAINAPPAPKRNTFLLDPLL